MVENQVIQISKNPVHVTTTARFRFRSRDWLNLKHEVLSTVKDFVHHHLPYTHFLIIGLAGQQNIDVGFLLI